MQSISSSIGGLGTLGGGIVGSIAAGPDRGHAQGLVDTGVNAWQGLNTPNDLADLINFQQYQNAGQLSPSQQQNINTGPSKAAQATGSPQAMAAQMSALQGLQGLSQSGMSSADRARLNQIQQQMATQAEGQRQQIMQNYAQRGQAGSGEQLLAELNASQNAANQANQQGLQVAGNAQQNALNALGQYGQQAGNIQQQQFGQQYQTGSAADLANRFNVQNQLGIQSANTNANNAAQQFNLQNKQNLSNQNTNLGNQALMLQKQGEQQLFQDQAQRAAGVSGSAMQGANAYNNMANQIAQGWTNMGQGAGQFLGGSNFGGSSTGGTAGGGNSSGGSDGMEGLAGGQGEGLGSVAEMFAANGGTVPSPDLFKSQNSLTSGSLIPNTTNSLLGQFITQHMAYGGEAKLSDNYMSIGGSVPGKPEYKHNDYRNDKVHAMLSPGEIVLPLSVTTAHDAPDKARDFVIREFLKRHGKKV